MPSLNRVVMNRKSRQLIEELNPKSLDVGEISGKWGSSFPFKSYKQFRYPKYDICQGPFLKNADKLHKFDLILANQVWEHLDRPYLALKHVRMMLKNKGYFWIAVPFHIPFHAAPMDNSRWSARGLKNLLIEAGFSEEHIVAEQWGNRHAAQRNLEDKWPPEYDPELDPLVDDPEMPICSWALAQKI